ncbi:MAG TPA: TRAP transporter small permease [Caldimonas sp.]|jgi:TRAP-type C4-dicarboxylate transport system permease small subunit
MSRLEIILQRALGLLAALILFFMMALTTVDVFGRYVFNKPVNGGFEVTEIMLAALIYCGLPLVSARREHIVIDTFDPFFSPGLKRALDVIAEILCMVVFGGVAVLIFGRAQRIASYGDTTTVLRLPLAPVAYVMAVMIAITAVIHLWLIFVPHKAHQAADAVADIKNAQ